MREGWEKKPLGDVIRLEYGKPLPKQERSDLGKYPVYGANGIKCKTNKYYWSKPSIIIGRKGSAGEVNLSESRFWPLDVTYFTVFDDNKFDLFYLFYVLKSLNLSGLAKGVKPGINRNDVYAIRFAFPPLPEQKRIVTILDEAFAGIDTAIANTEKNFANAREMFESKLNAVFEQKGEGWVEKRLGDLTSKIGSGATPRGGQSAYKKEGISLIRSLNVYDRYFTERKLAFIDEEQAGRLSNVVVAPDDILFNITGASVARCCVVPPNFLPARVNQHVVIIRPQKQQVSSEFLCYLMTSKLYKDILLGIGDEGGSTRQAITKAQLQDLSIAFPTTLDEQKKVTMKLDILSSKTQRLETIYQQKLSVLSQLKQSILQKALAGELTSRTDKILEESGL